MIWDFIFQQAIGYIVHFLVFFRLFLQFDYAQLDKIMLFYFGFDLVLRIFIILAYAENLSSSNSLPYRYKMGIICPFIVALSTDILNHYCIYPRKTRKLLDRTCQVIGLALISLLCRYIVNAIYYLIVSYLIPYAKKQEKKEGNEEELIYNL